MLTLEGKESPSWLRFLANNDFILAQGVNYTGEAVYI